ncbi:TPA: hypothetical protein ACTYTU_005645 [Klebsiella pneumoniae]
MNKTKGCLIANFATVPADMMATLKSNMTCLNIACAGALIDAMMQADARQAATI